MRFDLITIFPEFFEGPLEHGIIRKAREAGLIEIHVQELRVFTKDKHRTVDDRPYGGGEGMVLKPEPLFEAVEFLLGSSAGDAAAKSAIDSNVAIVLLSAAGKRFTQKTARQYAKLDRILFICGRYEGVDERVAEHLATEEISIGDFVLSGGELPAALIIDAVTRLLPGALGNEASSQNESFSETGPQMDSQLAPRTEELPVALSAFGAQRAAPLGRGRAALLDFPHYTRPADFRGWKVPDVLIGGNHAQVAKWRRAQALEKTRRNRPDLAVADLERSGVAGPDVAGGDAGEKNVTGGE
jgi:tRNA (guanine37-N1)-methyltransferase